MTSRDGSPQRLPPEVEFQARREEFLKRFHQLDERGEVNPGNANVISTPPIYFREGEEVFELSFSRRRYKNQSRAVQCERELEIAALKSDTRSIYGTVYDGKSERHSAAQVNCVLPYYPSADFTVVKEDPNGNLSGLNARHIESIGELDELINIINFMNDSISRGNSSESPITDIPGAVRDLVARIRKSERMKFEYKLPEFYDVLGRVRDKTAEVENIDKSGYKRKERVVLASTGWVEVEEGGERFELKLDRVNVYSNGDYGEEDEVFKREIGDIDGKGKYLFGSTNVLHLAMNKITTEEKLQECIDMLKLLDEAIPAPAIVSSQP